MTAFLDFLNSFAIWIYIAGVIGVLFGIKMLFDARRAARTTLFTLEQEQASDRAFRALLVMVVFAGLIAGVASVNNFLGEAIPTPLPIIEETEPSYTPPVIIDTATPRPTTTREPTTVALATAEPTETPPPPPPTVELPTAPPRQPTAPPATEAPPPTVVRSLEYPSITLNTPPNGDTIGSDNIRMSWGVNKSGDAEVPQVLPPDRWYRVSVTYNSGSRGQPVTLVYCTHESSMDRRTGLDVAETRQDSTDTIYNWSVLAVAAASQQACVTGDFSPLSPPSATSLFKLP